MKKSFSQLALAFALVLIVTGCKQATSSGIAKGSLSGVTLTGATPTPAPTTVAYSACNPSATPCAGQLCVSTPVAQSVDMNGTPAVFNITVTAGSNYSGDVKLSIVRDELDALDPPGVQTVTTSLSKATAGLGANCTTTVQVTVAPDSRAPVGAQHVHLVATDSHSAFINAQNENDFTINPILHIGIFGKQASTPTGANDAQLWDSPYVALVRSGQNVSVFFDNHDSRATHIVHIDGGMLPHQGTDGTVLPSSSSKAVSTGLQNKLLGIGDGTIAPYNSTAKTGGTYPGNTTAKNVLVDSTSNMSYYLHNEETAGISGRSIQLVSTSTSLNPLIPTYSNSIQVMIKRACLSCHSTGGQNPDLSTAALLKAYASSAANVIQTVTSFPGSTAGVMPPPSSGGALNPPHLSSQDLKMFNEWVTANYPN